MIIIIAFNDGGYFISPTEHYFWSFLVKLWPKHGMPSFPSERFICASFPLLCISPSVSKAAQSFAYPLQH